MLSTDLARLYGVEVRALIQAVQRNIERFPADFMFQLSEKELRSLRSQSATSIIDTSPENSSALMTSPNATHFPDTTALLPRRLLSFADGLLRAAAERQ